MNSDVGEQSYTKEWIFDTLKQRKTTLWMDSRMRCHAKENHEKLRDFDLSAKSIT